MLWQLRRRDEHQLREEGPEIPGQSFKEQHGGAFQAERTAQTELGLEESWHGLSTILYFLTECPVQNHGKEKTMI